MFRFRLDPVDRIAPGGETDAPTLSWFALSSGDFWIELGDVELFQYAPEMRAVWADARPHADYPLAAFVDDILACVGPALAPLPRDLEAVVASIDALRTLEERTAEVAEHRAQAEVGDAADERYAAWSWLSARSPMMSYLSQCPRFWFARIADDIVVGYDNRDCVVDGVPVWTAQQGLYRLSVDAFTSAAQALRDDVLAAMTARLDAIEAGRDVPRCAVDVAALRAQQVRWADDWQRAMVPQEPAVPWAAALASLALLSRDPGPDDAGAIDARGARAQQQLAAKQIQRRLATWAAACAERVLPLFETAHPDDPRPRLAIAAARAWARGEISVGAARDAAVAAHAAARAARDAAAVAAARAAGHAVATAHMQAHASHAATYAATAASHGPGRRPGVVVRADERTWQWTLLDDDVRPLGFPAGR